MDFRNLFALVYVLPALFSMYFGNALIGLLLVMGEGEYRTNNPQDNARLQIGQDFVHDPILNPWILFPHVFIFLQLMILLVSLLCIWSDLLLTL